MGLNFPDIPTVGQIFPSPSVVGVPLWKWDGFKWTPTTGGGLPVIRSYLAGLILSTAGSSATFSVAIGIAADSTAVDMIQSNTVISKTTSAWVVGTGNGGIDTGAVAINTWYHVHMIKRPDTSVVDVLFSLSATAPTLPTNYTLFRRIGSMRTNASSQWTAFNQYAGYFFWATAFTETITPVTTETNTTFMVPTGVRVEPFLDIQNLGSGNQVTVRVRSPDLQSSAGTATGLGMDSTAGVLANGTTTRFGFSTQRILTNTSGQLAVSAFGNASFSCFTQGWYDDRGQSA